MSSLGSISPLNIKGAVDFSYPESATILELLENVEDSTGNAIIQQSAITFPEATISGNLFSSSDRDLLVGYAAAKDIVAFTDPDSTDHSCIVMNLRVSRVLVQDPVWEYSCRLVEVG